MLSGGQAGLPVVQIAHMCPAVYPLGPVIGPVALGRALRRLGATADVGPPSGRNLAKIPFANEAYPDLRDRKAVQEESDVSL